MTTSPVFEKHPGLQDTIHYLVEDLRILEKIKVDDIDNEVRVFLWNCEFLQHRYQNSPQELHDAVKVASKVLRREVKEFRSEVNKAIGPDAGKIVELLWDSTSDHHGLMDFAVSGAWLEMDEGMIDIMAIFVQDGMDVLQSAYCARLV